MGFMTRRKLFRTLAGSVAGMALDPERLLWRPGAKLISIPKPRLGRPCAPINRIAPLFTSGVQVQAYYRDEFYRDLIPYQRELNRVLSGLVEQMEIQLDTDLKFLEGDQWRR